ncbi:MAG: DEAD/DEAH box helicase family protein, partial [Angelakisella sp.]
EMVLGKMVFDASMYGSETTTACHPTPGDDLDERLERAVSYLEGEYHDAVSELAEEKEVRLESIPADSAVRNFSYTTLDDDLYFRENSRMYKQEITGRKAERICGMVEISQAVRSLIDFQTGPAYSAQDLPTGEYQAELQKHLDRLNHVYDGFVKKYGALNSYGNIIAFSRDANAPLLRSLERESKTQKGVWEKTAMFYKATVRPKEMPHAVFSAEEALKVSLNVKGRLDLTYMSWLYQTPEHRKATPDEIIAELGDKIYQDPAEYTGNPHSGWVTEGEYLSGHVRDKLTEAILKADEFPDLFSRNVAALKLVQPTPLTPQEISFTLGTTWIPTDIYQQFMYDTFKTAKYNQSGRDAIALEFTRYGGAYYISRKSSERDSVMVNQTYGTGRLNAYEILESTLNLRSVEVKDPVDYLDPNTGEEKTKYVLNKKETILAREKQAAIRMEFESWLFADPERGQNITKLYNDRFNNIRPRVYDGKDLILPDMSEDIKLRPHQRDVVAHGLYGDGNLLMAHEVGAGKTYAAIVTAYELKRLGKVNKPLIAVPNHLVGQWAAAYMEIYPNANILVAEKKDFERKNRRRFVSRIATGDYDAVIMAHSSFELIGLSRERQLAAMKTEIDGITNAISEQKSRDGKDWSLKQMKIFQSNLQFRYDKLFKAEKKDDTINFEELGVDCLVVDEAHAYKNNFSYTKMRNVAGVSGQSSQRAMDMHQKCQYINEIGNGKGVIYLTGTPISNSMAELYVLQKTLQPKELEERDLLMFDSWASTYGKVESSLEIKPEGNGYQMKNRFAKFFNLPELMAMFGMIADIKTADMLDYLPVPKLKTGGVQVIKTACTPDQKRIVMEFGERAELIRDGKVDSTEDNFLKLTHEARLLSVDPRAVDPDLPDDPTTKLNVCAKNVAEIYHETAENRLAQLIFCDQGTPKYDGNFNFYEATKAALIEQGVKPEEIAFIHDAKTDVQREQLFERVRRGEIRILMGSTEKMGTGMNVQEKLIALHHLDVPWRPSDLTQRNGRILRQGNDNEEISIFNYITENTFDSYLWQILEQKQRYIAQIMTGRSSLRSCEDIDDTVLQYAEFKALATSNPRLKEKMETDNEISRLTVLKSSWQSQRNDLQFRITKHYPAAIETANRKIEKTTADLETYTKNKPAEFVMTLGGRTHSERTKAAEHLAVLSRKLGRENGASLDVGSYGGLAVSLVRTWDSSISLMLSGKMQYRTEMGDSELGNITRIENLAERIEKDKAEAEKELVSLRQQLADSLEESKKPFANEERLTELQKRKVELDLELEFKDDGDDVIDGEDDDMDEDEANGEQPTQPLTLNQRLYNKLYPIARPVLDGSAYHMKLKSGAFEDLVIENIGGGEYSIAHYYTQNGDAMRDPEITFTVDKADNSIHPTSFLQDDMGVFYETQSAPQAKVRDLEQFMSQWFTNIKNQGFEPTKISSYEDETEEEETDYER